MTHEPRRRRILAITSRASDHVELAELSVELARRGHHVLLIHLYAGSSRVYHESTIADCERINREHPNIEARAVDTDEIAALWRRWPWRRGAMTPKPKDKVRHVPWEERLLRWLDAHANALYQRAPRWSRRFLKVNVMAVAVFFLTPIYLGRLQSVKQVILAPPMYNRYRRFLRFFRQEIRAHSAEALLLPEDVVGYTWPLLIKAGHEHGIPSLVFPYTLANREEPLRSLKGAEQFQTALNPPFARMFPRWRWKDGTMDIMRLPFEHLFAHEALRVTPPDPWTMNSGYANRICVDSRAALDYFKEAGVPETKLEVTGSASQDKMHDLRTRKAESLGELAAQLGLEGDKPVLLVSGAPEQLAGQVPGCEFPDMDAIAAFVGECLQPLGEHYHLVVRSHPNFPRFGTLLEAWGFKSTQIPTSRLVPIADLFVAFASSTIRWAISCAVPTVNYDVFHYGYGDFAAARGVHSVQGRQEFRDVVQGLKPGSAAYADLAGHSAAASAHWSMMDGHCVERIEAAIQRECEHQPILRTSQ